MRSGHAERAIHCYNVTNRTKQHDYRVELFEDVHGDPYSWCDCQAAVICKHIKAALANLLENNPSFGEVLRWREEAQTPLTEGEDNAR